MILDVQDGRKIEVTLIPESRSVVLTLGIPEETHIAAHSVWLTCPEAVQIAMTLLEAVVKAGQVKQ